MFFILTVEVTPSLRCSHSLLKHRPQPGADPVWQFNVFWNTPGSSDKNSHPLGCSSTLQLEKDILLFRLAIAATEYPRGCPHSQEGPYVLALLSAVGVLGGQDSPQQSSPTTPGALVASHLTTASVKLNWELKGYTTGFSADVQTLGIILPVLCRKNSSTLHTRPKRKRLHYSHLSGSACRSSYVLSPAQGSLFQYHASYISFSLLSSREGAQKPPSWCSNSLTRKQIYPLSLRKKQIITALVTVSLFLTLRWLWSLPATSFQELYFPEMIICSVRGGGHAEERCAINFHRNVQFSGSNLVLSLPGGPLYLSLHLVHYLYLAVLITKNEAKPSHAMLKVVWFVSGGFQLLS